MEGTLRIISKYCEKGDEIKFCKITLQIQSVRSFCHKLTEKFW